MQLSLRIADPPAPAPVALPDDRGPLGAPVVECVRVGDVVRVRLVEPAAPDAFVRFPRELRRPGARYACAAVRLVRRNAMHSLDGKEPPRPYYIARGPYRLLPPPAPTEERGAGKARDAELLAPGEAPEGADVASWPAWWSRHADFLRAARRRRPRMLKKILFLAALSSLGCPDVQRTVKSCVGARCEVETQRGAVEAEGPSRLVVEDNKKTGETSVEF